MHRKERKELFKQYDFILLGEMSLQAAFLLSLFVWFGFMNPYSVPLYANMAIADIVVTFSYETFKMF